MIEQQLELERAVLKELKEALLENYKGRRDWGFHRELKEAIRLQGIRIVALQRVQKGDKNV